MPTISLILFILILALYGWAFVDALIRPQAAFSYAGTMNKWIWVGLLGLAITIRSGVLPLPSPLRFVISLGTMILVIYYLGPIRQQLSGYDGFRRPKKDRGSW